MRRIVMMGRRRRQRVMGMRTRRRHWPLSPLWRADMLRVFQVLHSTAITWPGDIS
jgi:hypothetical protein